MRLFRAQTTRCLMAALLVLVMGVIGPVQASVHAGSMTGHPTQIEANGSTLTGSMAFHAGHHAGHEPGAFQEMFHPGSDSPCVELCLLNSLAPSVGAEFLQPQTNTLFAAHAGAPIAQGQPATPPPKFLF